eukprot:Pgem_evm2s18396
MFQFINKFNYTLKQIFIIRLEEKEGEPQRQREQLQRQEELLQRQEDQLQLQKELSKHQKVLLERQEQQTLELQKNQEFGPPSLLIYETQ